jgi:integrase/recombinase XerD
MDSNIVHLTQYQRARPRSVSNAIETYAKHLTDFRSMQPRSVEVYIYEVTRFLKRVAEERLTAEYLVDPKAVITNGEALEKAKEEFLSTLSIDDVKQYVAALKSRDAAPATLHKVMAALKSFLHYAFKRGLTETNISVDIDEEIRLPRIGRQPVKTLSRDDVDKLLALPDLRSRKGRRDKVILLLGFVQALRREEMASLKLDDIYVKYDRPYILIHGKGGKVVEAPLRQDVYDAMQLYLKYRPPIESDRLLVTAKKPYQPMSPKTIWKLMETLGKKVGVKADVHSMRRAALSYTALAGLTEKGEAGSVLITQQLGRHEHASTTFRYIKDANIAKDPAVMHNPLGMASERKEDDNNATVRTPKPE